ncbi:hypothetical protein BN77_3837 [Rhizobium mesoamericanum STM3625]|uniref:Uncharacterized protein n=1 Tax=Rhizobium mesoamericanum STM3625 TaxID=1211777 RepID=K0PYK6_9HYPH|nr:hypothetical protein BN77_3837 [Rhizobium mesoamericanum STM3625]
MGRDMSGYENGADALGDQAVAVAAVTFQQFKGVSAGNQLRLMGA